MKMDHKNAWVFLFALFAQSIAICQVNPIPKSEIIPTSIHTANHGVKNERITLEWTMGESITSLSNSMIYISSGTLFPLRLDEIKITPENIYININEILKNITIYPNPFQHVIELSNETKLINIKSIVVYNTNGQILKAIKINESLFVSPYPIDLIDLPKGNYLLMVKITTINNGELFKLFKLIKI